MIRRPLALALAFVLAPSLASAEDLMQTYELARAGDPQFSAAESNRLATREGAVQARAAMLPQLDGTATLSRSRSEGPSTQTQINPANGQLTSISGNSDSETTSRRYGVDLTQMIYDHSRITTLRSQKALSVASDYQLEAAGDDLITRTSAAYFNVLVQLETLAAAQAAEDAAKKQFDYASKRLEVGLAPITDVHEAQAQYESARASTILTRNAVEDAYQALAEITGQPVRNLKALPADFQPALPNSLGVEEWVQTAIDNNPALQAKEYQLESAEANVNTARSGHYPRLYLNGSYVDSATWGDNTFTSGFGSVTNPVENESRGPQFGITLSVPIFAGGATQSGVRQALAQRDVVQDELVQQRRALERNARNAYQTLVAGISEVEARRLALVAAQSAYDASNVGLEVGTRTVLDVLQNQRNLFTAQQNYAQARYNYLQNRLLLEQAAGTLEIEDLQDINRLLTVDAESQVDL
ncbi:TolC family outer membrane protein [Marilutibacter chinensis]|uniref:TolC family outer membrane protein n=1 Tax=Marilutibacter chinensis TaxID=2912247 RepID=A0ABS9HWI6_9GAMM|nr:TolC family outer membrane protein [Lysobacter chinensis]MCF7223259.1 TolC family outer membrane protein [Lysobacter chinensis]